MIDQFYSPGAKLSHFRGGPLGAHIDDFASHLSCQGYATHTARLKIGLAADFSTWLARRHLDIEDLEEERLAEFLKTRKRRLALRRGDRSSLVQLLYHLRSSGAVPMPIVTLSTKPADRISRDYAQFLVHQRGLSRSTVTNYVAIACRFLEARFDTGKLSLNKLRVTDVTDFIVHGTLTDSPRRLQLCASALRSFLGFLTQQGKITTNLAASVPTVANYRLANLPQFLEPAQVANRCSTMRCWRP